MKMQASNLHDHDDEQRTFYCDFTGNWQIIQLLRYQKVTCLLRVDTLEDDLENRQVFQRRHHRNSPPKLKILFKSKRRTL